MKTKQVKIVLNAKERIVKPVILKVTVLNVLILKFYLLYVKKKIKVGLLKM